MDKTSLRAQLIAKPDSGITGTSRYAADLHRGLRRAGVEAHLTFPQPAPALLVKGFDRLGLDLRAFLASHPLRARLGPADLYHITTQTMATLLWTQRFPAPVVVTVLDIIPHLVRGDPELDTSRHAVDRLFYRLALSGLRRADALIAISQYSKRTLIDALGLPEERIHVVYPAVDHDRFRPLDVPGQFRARYGLDEGWRYVLYVGSDDPRKNLRTLVRAYALLKQHVGAAKLLKVGAPHFVQQRQQLLALLDDLGLQEDVWFFEEVPDEDLPFFYNVADVFAMPSLTEGFGLPVAEAMACGTPVVCSGEGSLFEVVGESAVVISPSDVEGLAVALGNALSRRRSCPMLVRKGAKQVQRFNLAQLGEGTMQVYHTALRSIAS